VGELVCQVGLVFGHHLPEHHYEFRAKVDCGVSSEETNFVFCDYTVIRRRCSSVDIGYKLRWAAGEKLFDALQVYRFYCITKHPNGLWCLPWLLSDTYRTFSPRA